MKLSLSVHQGLSSVRIQIRTRDNTKQLEWFQNPLVRSSKRRGFPNLFAARIPYLPYIKLQVTSIFLDRAWDELIPLPTTRFGRAVAPVISTTPGQLLCNIGQRIVVSKVNPSNNELLLLLSCSSGKTKHFFIQKKREYLTAVSAFMNNWLAVFFTNIPFFPKLVLNIDLWMSFVVSDNPET